MMIDNNDSGMDVSLEELLQDSNLDGDINEFFDENEDADLIESDHFSDYDPNEDVKLPPELSDYFTFLGSQTEQLEKELEECDELLLYMSHQPKDRSQAVVLYDDFKTLEQSASEQGLTVDEFTKKILNELVEEDFTEEDVKCEFEEFAQLQKELAETRSAIILHRSDDLKAILAPEDNTDDGSDDTGTSGVTVLAIDNVDVGSDAIVVNRPNDWESKQTEGGSLVSCSDLTDMRDYVIEQLRETEKSHEVLSLNLVRSIEACKNEEEKRMLQQEEQKQKWQQTHDLEEAAMIERLKENERVVAEEQKVRDEQVTKELNVIQAEIDKHSENLDKEKHLYEVSHGLWMEKLESTTRQAATMIQKVYRGHSARRQNKSVIQELKEWEELRKRNKHMLRVMEVEYEMKCREVQALKEKEKQERIAKEERMKKEEEERQIEIEQKKKEESERIIEELRKEMEKRKEEKRLEEERRKKEVEELRKSEQIRHLEEEKLRKEEEIMRRNEEKKRQKEEKLLKMEEKQKRKDEEKKKKEEEEKKRKEEEKKIKDEERRKKEEEKRKKEEEKKIKEEEKRKKEEDIKEEEKRKKEDEKRTNEEEMRKKEEKKRIDDEEKRKKEEEMNIKDKEDIRKKDEFNTHEEENLKKKVEEAKQAGKGNSEPKEERIMAKDVNRDKQMQPSALISGEVYSRKEPLRSLPCAAALEHAVDKSLMVQPSLTSGVKSETLQELVTASSRLPPSTFDFIEMQRLNWIKSCIPWSKVSCEPWQLKQTTQKSLKRPSQSKKLPPVSQSVILDAAHASSLREVSSIKLMDLPECSVSPLGQCWSLRYLTVTKCGLMYLDGLSQCKHLLYINAEYNNIEYVDLKELGSLQVVRLAHNNLSVIHGLEGCINLRWLDLSHNRITRISGLSSLRRAHTVDLSNNQIVSSQGLEEVLTVQHLDLSHNYLQHLTDVSKLCLLTDLNLSCNNLLEVPELKNQVLLQTLYLQENSIKSLEPLDKSWLPLLCALDCSQNILESVTGVSSLIQLSHLDVSLNQIADMENLLPGLTQNTKLESLLLEGNPLVDVYNEEYKQIIATSLPLLKSVDHQSVNPPTITTKPEVEFEMKTPDNFIQMCVSQIKLHAGLTNEFETQMKVLLVNCHVTGETLCSTYFTFCDTSFKMASEHRSAHEYGDSHVANSVNSFSMSIMDEKAKFNSAMEMKQQQESRADKNQTFNVAVNCVPESKNISEQIPKLESVQDKLAHYESEPSKQNQFNSALSGSDLNTVSSSLNSATPCSRFSSLATNLHSAESSTNIQANNYIKQDAHYVKETFVRDNGQLNANNIISSTNSDQSGQYLSEKDKFEMFLRTRTSPSSTIANNKNMINEITQGRVAVSQPTNLDEHMSLSGVKASVVGSQPSSLGVAGRSEELELSAHDVDETFDLESLGLDIDKYFDMEELDEFLDKGWRPADIFQNPFPVLEKINSGNSSGTNNNNGHNKGHDPALHQPPHQPSHAWVLSSASSDLKAKSPHATQGSGAASPLISTSPFSVASAAETIIGGSVRSKKEELSEEWGFKDSSTIEMMLARARKMKYNSERRRKLSQLDPQQRYHLLKKMEEKYRITATRPPSTKVLPRKEYFKAREEEMQHKGCEEHAENNTRLFEWLHTQVGDHCVSSSRINPGMISGYTSSDKNKNAAMGEIHARECSPHSDNQKSVYKDDQTIRRYSTGETQIGHTPVLPPIQQSSFHSSHKKERISFRDSPVERSGGWGGGRKKENMK